MLLFFCTFSQAFFVGNGQKRKTEMGDFRTGSPELGLPLFLSLHYFLSACQPHCAKKGERRKKRKGLLLLLFSFSFPLDPFILLLSLASFVPPFCPGFLGLLHSAAVVFFVSEQVAQVFFLRSCIHRLFSFIHHELVHSSQKQYGTLFQFCTNSQLFSCALVNSTVPRKDNF